MSDYRLDSIVFGSDISVDFLQVFNDRLIMQEFANQLHFPSFEL